MMKNENAGAHCLGFAVEDIIWRGQRASIVDQRFPVGTPITTANLFLSTHSQANRPAERAPNHREQERLEEQCQPDRGMTSTLGDAQTSCPPVDCSNGTAREQPAREGSCNASSLERSGSIDAELDNITVPDSPAPHSHVVPSELCDVTFAIQHNPNCPSPWLVRLVGKSGIIDMKPYGGPFSFMKHETTDRLGFGKTLEEAARAALATEGKNNV